MRVGAKVHWPDAFTPFEATAAALRELREEGKVRAVGVSNVAPDRMEAFRRGGPLHSTQPPYNVFEREIEEDVLPWCRTEGVAVLAYGALCRGLLTGKLPRWIRPRGDHLRGVDPKFRRPNRAAVKELDRLARERYGQRVLMLAVRWLLERPGVTTALWGARRPEQLDPVEEVWGWSLAEDGHREADRIVEWHVTDPIGPAFMAPPEAGG